MQLGIVALEPRQIHVGELRRFHFAGANQFGQLRHGLVGEFVEAARASHDGHLGTDRRRFRLFRQLLAGRERVEHDRGEHAHVERFLVQRLDSASRPGEALRHRLPLFIGELESCNLFSGGDLLGRDVRGLRLALGLGPQDARQQRGSEADGAEVRHERAPIVRCRRHERMAEVCRGAGLIPTAASTRPQGSSRNGNAGSDTGAREMPSSGGTSAGCGELERERSSGRPHRSTCRVR